MNTILLSALCFLGTWAVLAGGVTVQVNPVSLPWPGWPSAPSAQALCPERAFAPWGWSRGRVSGVARSQVPVSQPCLLLLPLPTWRREEK